MGITFPGESTEYRTARDELLRRELDLRRATEAVAAARRALPPGGEVAQDYELTGADGPVRLAELVGAGGSLVIYHMMFPRDPGDDRPGAMDGPCPSCVGLLDQLEGMADAYAQNGSFVVVAKAPIEQVLAFAAERGWTALRFVSSAGTRFNRDYHAESETGAQRPMLNVFERRDGAIRHFWGSELFYAETDPGQDTRHVGPLEPLWNMFDFTPEGRPAWDEQLEYGCH
jgi:predicted dithiol-disulfide oxidoreductase (DUF899 family)